MLLGITFIGQKWIHVVRSLQTQHVQQPSTICAWCSIGALIAGQALCETVKWL